MLCTQRGLGSPRRWRTLIRLDCDAAAGLLVAAEAQAAADRRELALINDTVPVGAILRRGALEDVGAGLRRGRGLGRGLGRDEISIISRRFL